MDEKTREDAVPADQPAPTEQPGVPKAAEASQTEVELEMSSTEDGAE